MTRSWLSAQTPAVDPIWKPEPHQFCGHPATSSYGPVVSPPPFSLGNCCASMTPVSSMAKTATVTIAFLFTVDSPFPKKRPSASEANSDSELHLSWELGGRRDHEGRRRPVPGRRHQVFAIQQVEDVVEEIEAVESAAKFERIPERHVDQERSGALETVDHGAALRVDPGSNR